jgi:hypothetical protein
VFDVLSSVAWLVVIAAAAILGFVATWVTFKPPRPETHRRWLSLYIALTVIGMAAAIVDHIADGREKAAAKRQLDGMQGSLVRIEGTIQKLVAAPSPTSTNVSAKPVGTSLPALLDFKVERYFKAEQLPVPNGYVFTPIAQPNIKNPRFRWDFGDGSSAVTGLMPIIHVYAQPGTYTVRLTVSVAESPRIHETAVIGRPRRR